MEKNLKATKPAENTNLLNKNFLQNFKKPVMKNEAKSLNDSKNTSKIKRLFEQKAGKIQ